MSAPTAGIADGNPPLDRAAQEQRASDRDDGGDQLRQRRAHRRRADVRGSDLGRRDDKGRSERGGPDDGEKDAEAGAETRYPLWH